jgi:glutamate dehydrogenase
MMPFSFILVLLVSRRPMDLERLVKGGVYSESIYNHASHSNFRIDDMFLDISTPQKAYRLETYRSTGTATTPDSQSLRCYFISQCVFPSEHKPATPTPAGKAPRTDIRSVSDKLFLEKASEHTLEVYQKIMWNVEERYGPVIEFFEVKGTREKRVVIGYKMGTTAHFFSALSQLYHFYSLYSARKYVEQFANGVTIICTFYLTRSD